MTQMSCSRVCVCVCGRAIAHDGMHPTIGYFGRVANRIGRIFAIKHESYNASKTYVVMRWMQNMKLKG